MHEIGIYISKVLLEPETAKKVISKVSKSIFSLENMPLRNALVADERLADRGIRKIIVDNYIIFYIVIEESKIVIVVRILYGKRNWLNLL